MILCVVTATGTATTPLPQPQPDLTRFFPGPTLPSTNRTRRHSEELRSALIRTIPPPSLVITSKAEKLYVVPAMRRTTPIPAVQPSITGVLQTVQLLTIRPKVLRVLCRTQRVSCSELILSALR